MGGQAPNDPTKPFVIIPFIPPSSNNIYVTNWKRKTRFLSAEAEAFKKRVLTLIAQEKAFEISQFGALLKNDPNAMFWVDFVFYFEDADILNTTFGSGKKGAAETRYKRMDVENRVKLVTDSFAKAIGIDDSLFFHGSHSKCSARLVGGTPQIHVFFYPADPARFGL